MIAFDEGHPWFEIRDATSSIVLARGPVVGPKTKSPKRSNLSYISVDGKWFFNTTSPKFKFFTCSREEGATPFSAEQDYEWAYWKERDEKFVDIYRDFGLDELDPEVVELVNEMNEWEGITTQTSCSGHGKHHLWIQFNAKNLDILQSFINILRTPCMYPDIVDKFELCMRPSEAFTMTDGNIMKKERYEKCDYVTLTLMSRRIGDEAYADASRLTNILRESRQIYRDFDMRELDPEIEPLVTEMDLWKGIKTQASCSGHGKYAPWVQFVAEDPRILQILLDVLRSPDTFPRIVGKFELSMDSTHPFTMIWSKTPHIHEGVLLTLMAKNIGEEAYADILRLSHYMSETRNFFETNKVIKW